MNDARAPLVLAFTGMDGSGKSTQVRLLTDRLRALGLAVTSAHQYSGAKGTASHAGSGAQRLARALFSSRERARETGAGGWPRRLVLRSLGEVVGAASLAVGALRAWTSRGRRGEGGVVLLDRCFIDEIVRVRWRLGASAPLGPLLLRLVPRPDLVFHLDTPHELAWARKKADWYSEEQFLRKRAIVEATIASAGRTWQVRRVAVGARPANAIADALAAEISTGHLRARVD